MGRLESMGDKMLCCKREQRNRKVAAEGKRVERVLVFAFR